MREADETATLCAVFNKYYQEELAYLRDMGKEFARAYPEIAHLLGEKGTDPDVERLLEGVAFLTGRIRQRMDDEFPEILHGLLQLLCPYYLRPIPSVTTIQFDLLPQAQKEPYRVAGGVELASVPVDGVRCLFRTAEEIVLNPLTLERFEFRTEKGPTLRGRFALPGGLTLGRFPLPSIRLTFSGEALAARFLYHAFTLGARSLKFLHGADPNRHFSLDLGNVRPVGFDEDSALFPFPHTAFPGFRILQEYLAYPARFLAVEIHGLERLASFADAMAFEFELGLARTPREIPPVGPENLLLNCVSAVNLFRAEGDPIRIDYSRSAYEVRPSGGNRGTLETYSVDRVFALLPGSQRPVEVHPFLRFGRDLSGPDRNAPLYQTRLAASPLGEGTDTHLSLAQADALPEGTVLSLSLTCTNGSLPAKLRPGDVREATDTSPSVAKFRNIDRPTPSYAPPLDAELLWTLLANVSLGAASFRGVEDLRTLLEIHHIPARHDRQAERSLHLLKQGLRSLRIRPAVDVVEGALVHGVESVIEVDEDKFAGEGDLALFGAVLDQFFRLRATLNSFSRLRLVGQRYGEVYEWPARKGQRPPA